MATSKAQVLTGTAFLVGGEAGADVALSAEGLASASGRVSDQHDLGASPRSYSFSWSCEVQFQATPDQGGTLDIYIAGAPDADATQIDGDIGASDAALGDVDMRQNLRSIGSVTSENAAASEKCVASGTFTHYSRYISFVIYNGAGASINATDTNFRLDITPFDIQGQAT